FALENLPRNSSGYEFFILLSNSQVAFSPTGPPQTTFTDVISLFLNFFTSLPSILRHSLDGQVIPYLNIV
ncbi:hypothetical protein A2U01_0073594, partial [Trifolium medium]|nr:hypothetical protein [Trifolium medium]